jgi:hypothetical protein
VPLAVLATLESQFKVSTMFPCNSFMGMKFFFPVSIAKQNTSQATSQFLSFFRKQTVYKEKQNPFPQSTKAFSNTHHALTAKSFQCTVISQWWGKECHLLLLAGYGPVDRNYR